MPANKLLFDLSAAQTPHGVPAGGAEYAVTVFKYIAQRYSSEDFCCVYSNRMPISDELLDICRSKGIELFEVSGCGEIQRLLEREEIVRFYTAMPYDLYALDFSAVELVFTFHGLRQVEKPADDYESFFATDLRSFANAYVKRLSPRWWPGKYAARYRELLFKPSKKTSIVVVSNHTKYSLMRQYPDLDPESIRVLYSPLQPPLDRPAQGGVLQQFGLSDQGYLLVISAGRWIKNAYRCMSAVQQLYADRRDLSVKTFVCGVDARLVARFRKRFPDSRFQYVGYLDYSDLTCLLENAMGFIYPTLNEGFGYPPLEAMRRSTPAACAAVTSIPEVCGQAVLYFNPYDTDEIYSRVLQLVTDESTRQALRERGQLRYSEIARRQEDDLRMLGELLLRS